MWTPETLCASQSEKDTGVPCCLHLSEDSDDLADISWGERRGGGAGKVPRSCVVSFERG